MFKRAAFLVFVVAAVAACVADSSRNTPPAFPEPAGKAPASHPDVDEPEKQLFTFVHMTDTHCLTTRTNPIKPPKGPPLSFLGIKTRHWKDFVNSFKILSAAVKHINSEIRPDFVIHTGDITDRSGVSDLQKAKKILDKLKYPYYACQGDHDARRTEGAYNYLKVFDRRCASFDIKGWHFVMMGIFPTDEELEWLEADLAKSGQKRVVLCHD